MGNSFLLLAVSTFVFFMVGMAFVVYGTVVKNKWGINFDTVSCPHCRRQVPHMRKPNSLQQHLWGGYTCPCGIEVDKWGREVGSKS